MSGPSQGLPTGTSSLLTQVTPAELQQLFDLSPDALVVINRAGMVTGINRQAEELFGYSSTELVSQQIEVLLPRRLREVHIAHREHFSSAPQPRPMGAGLSLYGRRKDATEFPVDISLKPVSLHHELHVIGTIRDMTVQKRLEEQSRLKSQFLANMSHELRTPLTSIIGFADLLHERVIAPEIQKEYLEDILASARHQLQLVNDILDLSKVEAGQIAFQPEPVDVARLIAEVQMLLRPLVDKKHLRIETALDSSLNAVTLDPTRLKQLLLNYLSNAIKFTDEGGTISIRIKPENPDTFRLEVEDTGIGIRPEDLGRLFAVFQQLDGGMGKQYQGTGLGLALSKHLVEAQGGYVGVKSTPGQGSTFFAVLPRVFDTNLRSVVEF